jgi:hypothetical protein
MTHVEKRPAAQVQRKARQWLQVEIERSRKAMGPAWPQHREWVLDYLRAELAQKLAWWRHE